MRIRMKSSKNSNRTLLIIVCSIITSLGLVFSIVEKWVFHTWESLSYDEIVYHLNTSLEGTNSSMIREVICISVIPVAAFVAALGFLIYIRREWFNRHWKIVFVLMSFSVLLSIFSLYDFQVRTDFVRRAVSDLFKGGGKSAFIEEHYVDPAEVKIAFPEKKRNLVYVFLESMEMTFADKNNNGGFEFNCIPELSELGERNEDFSGDDPHLNGAISLPGTDWTMGAMFAQTSGVPLKIPLSGNAMAGRSSFFSELTVLGDILAAAGYHQVLLIGSDAKFGGRDIYFSEHGKYELHDYIYAKEKGLVAEDYHVWWGYEDEKLFQFAKEDLKRLSEEGQPFNYTLLTVDTHFSDGYVCRLCKDEFGDNQYANVYACSSRQVVKFVEWLQDQDFYDNTTFVFCGDHPTMDGDFCRKVASVYQRKTFMTIINGAGVVDNPQRKRDYSTLDMFPTTLAAMGIDIDGDRLGLGVNLYSDTDTIVEQYRLQDCEEELGKSSPFLEELSGVVIGEDEMKTVRKNAALEFVEHNGEVWFKLTGINRLNAGTIKKAELEIKEAESGSKKTMPIKIIRKPGDPNVCWGEINTHINTAEKDHYSFEAYLSTEDVENYSVAVYPDTSGGIQ